MLDAKIDTIMTNNKCDATEELQELVQNNPEEARAFADKIGGRIEKRITRLLNDVQ